MPSIADNLFTYIDKSADLTQSMVDQNPESMIVLGDEQQMFIPRLSSYIGIPYSSYLYILDLINNMEFGATRYFEVFHTNVDHEFNLIYTYNAESGIKFSYVNEKIKVNPYQEYIKTKTFIGDLEGNSYTTTKLKDPIYLWGNKFDGTESLAYSIIPSGDYTYNIGSAHNYFKTGYIGYIYGDLYGTANHSIYNQYSYNSYIIPTNDTFIYKLLFTHFNNNDQQYYAYSYVDVDFDAVVPDGKNSNDIYNIHDAEMIRFKGFGCPIMYSPYLNTLFVSYVRANVLGISSYADLLYDPRKINGTYFSGGEDITTTYWGYERIFKISDYYNAYTGPSQPVHGDQDITLNLPNTIKGDLFGNAYTSTLSEFSQKAYKLRIGSSIENKSYYLVFSNATPDTDEYLFSYTYTSYNLSFNPGLGTLYSTYFSGWLSGTANSAVKLLNQRKINNTYFDGTSDIITSYWGEMRNITLEDYYSTYSYINTYINGSEDFKLKLPDTIHANLNGNADTATWSKSAYLANRVYRQQINLTSYDCAYYVQLTNTTMGYAYSFVNGNLIYNPYEERMSTSYFAASELFEGQVRARDQWGVLGDESEIPEPNTETETYIDPIIDTETETETQTETETETNTETETQTDTETNTETEIDPLLPTEIEP